MSTLPTQKAPTVLAAAAWAAVTLALYLIFFVAREADAAMGGQLQRIFYFHVSSAWIAYLCFAIVFIGSIAFLRTGERRWDLLAHSSAEVGVVFCSLVLITGPIWARPVWGTWWQWDARLTLTFVMWLTYVGYLILRAFAVDRRRVAKPAAVVGILGALNIPLVHFSIYLWRTLHPSGPTIANLANLADDSGLGGPELLAFFASLGAFTLLFAWMLVLRMRLGRLEDEVENLEATAGAT
jgi:heme exporter protein C